MTDETIAVRLDMSMDQAERFSELLPRVPADVRARLRDQLWLMSVLAEQRGRTVVAERATFTRRANRILALLDPQEER